MQTPSRNVWTGRAVADWPTWDLPGPFVAYADGDYDSEWGPSPKTRAELRMYQLSWALRSKPEWQRKTADPEIRAKWRKEALEQQQSVEPGNKMTEKMIDYVLAELDGYAKIADNEKGIERGCYDAIWYSDRLISDEVTQRLKSAASALENVPEEEKDWHPGSNGQVLDLVHPSLYCIVYGRTHAHLPDKPRTQDNFLPVVFSTLRDDIKKWMCSEAFCWLPSDFAVDENGSVTLLSPYINNLHPARHQPLYRIIEDVLTGFIPVFEHVLGDIDRESDGGGSFDRTDRLGKVSCIWGEGGKPWPEDEPKTDEDEDEFYDKFYASVQKVYPDANPYTGALDANFSPVSLRGRTIQCIVKLANIHLTPESPEYAGGSWHVEGMVNESIVASGIYYYDEENITESTLSFRVATGQPGYHGQDDSTCMKILYGISRDDICVQDIGAMVTKAGRALSWPNLFQHRVSSFKLADPSKPGHRKILALFLVDPTIDPIASATDVPPQQAEWAAEAFEEASVTPESAMAQLPRELVDLVKKQFSSTVMTRKEAEAYRLELMKERTAFVQAHTDTAYGLTFNMCEH
ncbi:hypothetical protein B0H10DRAFT_1977475 [Mycena sp. CBHHK59/15]|nr:hypothetical protein B0H10DRAFT_1977475 [Mycena sp. CBHHK59/15]